MKAGKKYKLIEEETCWEGEKNITITTDWGCSSGYGVRNMYPSRYISAIFKTQHVSNGSWNIYIRLNGYSWSSDNPV